MKQHVTPLHLLLMITLSMVALPSGVVLAQTDMAAVINAYETDRNDLRRFYAIGVSPTRFDRLEVQTREWLERLDDIDFDSLDIEGQIDYVLLRNHLERELKQIAFDRRRQDEITKILPFASAIIELEETRWEMEPVDGRASAAALDAIRQELVAARQALEASRRAGNAEAEFNLTPVTAQRAASSINSLIGALRNWFTYHDGFKPEFSWWTKQPYDDLVGALRDYARLLREDVAGQRGRPNDPLVGDPLGRQMLLDEIAHEFVPYTPEELIAIAEHEFAWCEARMQEAADALGYDDWREALEYVKTLHAAPGEQDMLVAQQAKHAIDFLDARDLVTIPPLARELWRLEMLSADRQRILPFAAYGGQHMLIAFPTNEMDHTRKLESMRGNNIHFTRIVTPHELIPGHHLQGFMAARFNTHRRLFRTPFLVEGWCLYWEMLFWDLDYAESPENQIGMLFWRMHRCARIIISLRFHLGEMASDEMIDFLVNRVGHERDGATSEVRRYVGDQYSPLYQAAYMLGGIQMMQMRREFVDTGLMSDREFHDAILKCNSIPFELIRASLGNALPDPRARSTWRFAEHLLNGGAE